MATGDTAKARQTQTGRQRKESQPAAVREPNRRVGRHRSPAVRFSLRRQAARDSPPTRATGGPLPTPAQRLSTPLRRPRSNERDTAASGARALEGDNRITINAAGLSPTGDDAGALPYGSGAGRNSTSCSAETRTTSSVSVISWSWSNSSLRRPAGETQKRQRVGSWVVLK